MTVLQYLNIDSPLYIDGVTGSIYCKRCSWSGDGPSFPLEMGLFIDEMELLGKQHSDCKGEKQ